MPGTSTGGGNVADDHQFSVRAAGPKATAAVPEPDSIALIGLAPGGPIVTRKRRRSKD